MAGLVLVPASPAYAANNAPTAPTLLTPAPGGGVNGSVGQFFTVLATDPNGDLYSVVITVSGTPNIGGSFSTFFETNTVPSNQEATGTPTLPIPPGSYTWSATATDVHYDATESTVSVLPGTTVTPAALSELTGPASASQAFTVSVPPTFGAGEVNGDVSFMDPGLPPLGAPCSETDFTVTGNLVDPTVNGSAGVVFNIAGNEYIGSLVISGTGHGDCANASAGSGSLTITGIGTGEGGSIRCDVNGHFVRVLSHVDLALPGTCTVNSLPVANVMFRSEVEFRPDPGQGVSSPVTHAIFAGYFSLLPA